MSAFSLDLQSGAWWLLVLLLAAAALFSWYTYRRTIPVVSDGRRRTLIILRTIGLFLILFVLFQPIFHITDVSTRTPVIALGLDDSRSMQLPASNTAQTRGEALKRSLGEVFPKDFLASSEKLSPFRISDSSRPSQNDSLLSTLRFAGSATDLGSLFERIRQEQKTKSVQAIVLYTDGAFTAGTNPIYPAEELGLPVYIVGLGDSSEVRDLAVTDIFTNEVATVGTSQPVDVTARYSGLTVGEHAKAVLTADGVTIGEQTITAARQSGDAALSFAFTPTKEGVVKLAVRFEPLQGETTVKNNTRIAYVRVLKNKFTVSLIAGAPSADVSFIASHFRAVPSIELQMFVQKEGAEFYGPEPTAASLASSDLLIFVGFPIASTSEAVVAAVRQSLLVRKTPLLFVSSSQLDPAKLGSLSAALPFQYSSVPGNELKVSLRPSSDAAPDPLLTQSKLGMVNWSQLPPLFRREGHLVVRSEAKTVAGSSLQGVDLGEPLLLRQESGGMRSVAVLGYGLWQWQLLEYGRERSFAADTGAVQSPLDIFLNNATRWLTTHDDEKRVRVEPSRRFYDAGEPIEINGQVYDESLQPIDNADVAADLLGGGLISPTHLVLEKLGSGRYRTSLPSGLPAGDYTLRGSARRTAGLIGTDEVRFNVGEFNVEFTEPRMRSDILRAMAERTGGKFYTPETASSLLRDLQNDPQFAPREETSSKEVELWNSWPILLAAIVAFAMEWYLRKRYGML